MMRDDWTFVGGLIAFLLGMFICCMSLMYAVENVPLVISVDGQEVYHGRSACVETQSIGSSSRVDVKTGPFCLFPKEYYAGKNVVIKTAKI